jgi:hypothetical protein
MVGISASLSRSVRNALRPLLVNRYARYSPNVPVVPAENDAWGNPVIGDGPTTSGLPCLYMSQRRQVVRDQGTVLLDVPTLTVYDDDALAVGDRVTVTTKGGTVLATDAVVESFDPSAESGESVLKVAVLGAATATT